MSRSPAIVPGRTHMGTLRVMAQLPAGAWGILRLGALAVAMSLLADVSLSAAQTTSITSSGLGTSITAPPPGGKEFQIQGGTPSGTNLFHSFGRFTVGAGDTARFINTTGPTTNIVGRVTGGALSNILGTIDTLNFPGANLFLINPAGMIFGATAKLNV